jgi:hypothetical protein
MLTAVEVGDIPPLADVGEQISPAPFSGGVGRPLLISQLFRLLFA